MPTSAAATSPYAGFWLRFVAAIIDGIILAVVNFVLTMILGAIFGLNGIYIVVIVSYLITGVLGLLYWSMLESGPGQATLGKRVLRLKVTNMSGGRIDFATAVMRSWVHWLAYFLLIVDVVVGLPFFVNGNLGLLSGLVALAALVSAIMIAFTPMKQGFHDQIAKTLVVRA
jgi:uncharacterized RDD family membrane protein YckC